MLEYGGLHPLGWEKVAVPSEGVQVSRGQTRVIKSKTDIQIHVISENCPIFYGYEICSNLKN